MKIAVLGLDKIGAPLAIELAKSYDTVGFDIRITRVNELKQGKDRGGDIGQMALLNSHIHFTWKAEHLADVDVFIVTTTAPPGSDKSPDLTGIKLISKILSGRLKQESIVLFEHGIYEEIAFTTCVPILEEGSGLKWKDDFWIAASPFRSIPNFVLDAENLEQIIQNYRPTKLIEELEA